MVESTVPHIDNRRVYPITLVWGMLLEDRKVPVLLDYKVRVMEGFTLFAQYKAREYLHRHTPSCKNSGAYTSFINDLAYTLTAFAEYLRSRRVDWRDIDDSRLEEFKHLQHDSVLAKKNSLTQETANVTVNRKLRIIYEFYWWAQHVQMLIHDRIGPDVGDKIRSNIAKLKKDPGPFRKDKSAMRTVYPLCESVTAEVSRHRRQHYATNKELTQLKQYFRSTCDPLTAERNVLIVDIIDNMGWREGSVASLTVGQFSQEKINNSLKNLHKTVTVTPAQQKRGYENPYDAVLQLVIRINRYIREVRDRMYERLQDGESKLGGDDDSPLFVSYTTGKALTAKSISRIISDGFKSIGVVGRRAGPHSIRRKFGKDKCSEIVQERQRRGLSTDPQDVIFDLAEFLGHSSLAAQNAYNADKRDIYSDSVECSLRGRIVELEATEASLRLEAVEREKCIKELEEKLALAQKH